MERAKVKKEEVQQQDTRFLSVFVESKNSVMIMLSEKEDKLGTLAIAVPKHDPVGQVTSSCCWVIKTLFLLVCLQSTLLLKLGKSLWFLFT